MINRFYYRRNLPIYNNHTNNYVETAVRLFKDSVLNRKKAFNAVELINFVVETMTEYYQRRLTDFANFRNVDQHLLLEEVMERSRAVDAAAIEECGDKTFLVPSQVEPLVKYVVDTELGTCSCEYGMYGRFCKHMGAVFAAMHVPLPNFPCVTAKDRHQLAWVALGDGVMPLAFYQPLHGGHIDEFVSSNLSDVFRDQILAWLCRIP